jgi:pyruvate kinase
MGAAARRAKIVATLGPASADEAVVRGLIRAGVDLFRLNLSHGTRPDHHRACELMRRLAGEERLHLPVMFDLMGPRYRLGTVPGEPRLLAPGEEVSLGGAGADLPVDDPRFLAHLRTGERVLIDGGRVELRIEAREGERVRARVVAGGPVGTRKGLNLPDSELPFEISDKDRADIAFAVREQADYLAASYVGAGEHLAALRREVAAAGGRIPLIAKLERAAAIERLDEIIAAADGLMVARGDLGVEVPLYQVPVLQKRIAHAGRLAGKPVIVATQMLESMIEQARPTRAEATDVANAVLDGADALMLSGETAVGRQPVAVIETMVRIVEEAEAYARAQAGAAPLLQPLGEVHARRTFAAERAAEAGDAAPPAGAAAPAETEAGASTRPARPGPGGTAPPAEPEAGAAALEVPDVVSAAAVQAASHLAVARIVAFSQGGFTARLVARYRPAASIIAFTPDAAVARQVQLVWGVRPLCAGEEVATLDEVVQLVERQLLAAGLAAPGERILILMGHPIRDRPLTNLMRVHTIGP